MCIMKTMMTRLAAGALVLLSAACRVNLTPPAGANSRAGVPTPAPLYVTATANATAPAAGTTTETVSPATAEASREATTREATPTPGGIGTFTSDALGITFQYELSQNGVTVSTKEAG